jgi:hypothetical protein
MILIVVWVVLMILWLFGGGFVAYGEGKFNGRDFAGYTLIPWICVAIIGYKLFENAPGLR